VEPLDSAGQSIGFEIYRLNFPTHRQDNLSVGGPSSRPALSLLEAAVGLGLGHNDDDDDALAAGLPGCQ
jgi:hypothetical protein